jgi:predicted nucleotidyltransferase
MPWMPCENRSVTARVKGRRRVALRLVDDIEEWALEDGRVQGIALVGSYARGAERMASDIDLVILTDDPDALADSTWFSTLRPGSRLVRSARWGPIRERRYRIRSGLLVELDFAPLDWAAVPLDAGTQRVLSDGHRIIYDTGLLEEASTASR